MSVVPCQYVSQQLTQELLVHGRLWNLARSPDQHVHGLAVHSTVEGTQHDSTEKTKTL